MTAKEIAAAALAMQKPDNLSLIEQRLYWTLVHIYKLHARGCSAMRLVWMRKKL